MELKFDTEEAFYIFHGIMENIGLREMFQSGLADLMDRINAFSETLKVQEPQIFRKLTKDGVNFPFFNLLRYLY